MRLMENVCKVCRCEAHRAVAIFCRTEEQAEDLSFRLSEARGEIFALNHGSADGRCVDSSTPLRSARNDRLDRPLDNLKLTHCYAK